MSNEKWAPGCLELRSTPPPSNSHHQDYYIFSRESRNPYKPSFATVTGWGVDPIFRGLYYPLSQWLTGFKLLGIPNISRENKVQTFFFRVHWLSEVYRGLYYRVM